MYTYEVGSGLSKDVVDPSKEVVVERLLLVDVDLDEYSISLILMQIKELSIRNIHTRRYLTMLSTQVGN